LIECGVVKKQPAPGSEKDLQKLKRLNKTQKHSIANKNKSGGGSAAYCKVGEVRP
jgi:hypothetical protein